MGNQEQRNWIVVVGHPLGCGKGSGQQGRGEREGLL